MPCNCKCCCGCCCDGSTGSQSLPAQCESPKEFKGKGTQCDVCCDLGEIREDITSEEDCTGTWIPNGRCQAVPCEPPPPPECSGPCDEENPCPEGCYCCDGVCQSEPCGPPPECLGNVCDPNVEGSCPEGCECRPDAVLCVQMFVPEECGCPDGYGPTSNPDPCPDEGGFVPYQCVKVSNPSTCAECEALPNFSECIADPNREQYCGTVNPLP